MPSNEIALSGNLPVLGNGQLSPRTLKEIERGLAGTAKDMVISGSRLEAGAFLSSVGMTHLGTLAAVAEAVVEMHPAAAQGCAQILQAYGMGAADMIRRTLR